MSLIVPTSDGHTTYEDALAAGAPLSAVYALAAMPAEREADGGADNDVSAISNAPTVPALP